MLQDLLQENLAQVFACVASLKGLQTQAQKKEGQPQNSQCKYASIMLHTTAKKALPQVRWASAEGAGKKVWVKTRHQEIFGARCDLSAGEEDPVDVGP